MKKSELQNLREQVKQLTELRKKEESRPRAGLDTSTIDKAMKFELLAEHWDEITIDDIEAIIRR